MPTVVIGLPEAVIDDDLGLPDGGEPLGIENLAAESSVEAFVVSVLPGLSGAVTYGLYAARPRSLSLLIPDRSPTGCDLPCRGGPPSKLESGGCGRPAGLTGA
jgi:hypothetical protein